MTVDIDGIKTTKELIFEGWIKSHIDLSSLNYYSPIYITESGIEQAKLYGSIYSLTHCLVLDVILDQKNGTSPTSVNLLKLREKKPQYRIDWGRVIRRLDSFENSTFDYEWWWELEEIKQRESQILGDPIKTEEAAYLKIKNVNLMRQFYKDYSNDTAQEILGNVEKAWGIYCDEGGRWGPGKFTKVVAISATTIGRYINAFKKAGINSWNGIDLP